MCGDGGRGGCVAFGGKKRGEGEGKEAGRACGERAEGVGCVWGGKSAFWDGIKRCNTSLK